MTPADQSELVRNAGVVAVVRISDRARLRSACSAMVAGGVKAIEITMSVPGAIEVIGDLDREFGSEWLIGAGSVRDAETAKRAANAGARYVVSPVMVPEVIRGAHEHGAAACIGAFSPTEVHRATQEGADIVKVFPADVAGMSYFKALLAPMPELKLMPTGGVTLDNAGDWIRAGAVAVGVGSALLKKDWISEGNWAAIEDSAKQLTKQVAEVRETLAARS
ncbi:MAG: bifunctional 4-hydroxy-2-oxoglutarate aldolase/2-dehydro-3-deoxy-phosphogluconate aldolase [Planctomycetota bacterium]